MARQRAAARGPAPAAAGGPGEAHRDQQARPTAPPGPWSRGAPARPERAAGHPLSSVRAHGPMRPCGRSCHMNRNDIPDGAPSGDPAAALKRISDRRLGALRRGGDRLCPAGGGQRRQGHRHPRRRRHPDRRRPERRMAIAAIRPARDGTGAGALTRWRAAPAPPTGRAALGAASPLPECRVTGADSSSAGHGAAASSPGRSAGDGHRAPCGRSCRSRSVRCLFGQNGGAVPESARWLWRAGEWLPSQRPPRFALFGRNGGAGGTGRSSGARWCLLPVAAPLRGARACRRLFEVGGVGSGARVRHARNTSLGGSRSICSSGRPRAGARGRLARGRLA